MELRKIKGLDTLRFVAALCVAFSHGAAFPIDQYVRHESGASRIVIGLYNNLFNGPAAVMIFFVISGFCIHYNFACGRPFQTVSFFLRRGVRIGLPLIAAIGLASALGQAPPAPWRNSIG